MNATITGTRLISAKTSDMNNDILDESKVTLYQLTSGFFCVEQEAGNSIPLFEHKLYGKTPYELILPYRTYMISAFPNYSHLKRRIAESPPGVVLLLDLALRDLDDNFDASSASGAISSAISKIKNADPKKDKRMLRKNLRCVIDELWSLTNDRRSLILGVLWDDYPGLAEHLTNEYPRVIAGSILEPIFQKGGHYAPIDIGPSYGRRNSVRHVCEQIEKIMKK